MSWAKASVGAVATQSYADLAYDLDGLALIAQGMSAADTIKALIGPDESVGLCDRSAQWTHKDRLRLSSLARMEHVQVYAIPRSREIGKVEKFRGKIEHMSCLNETRPTGRCTGRLRRQ